MARKTYYVYILSSRQGILYTGLTSNLRRRMEEHINAEGSAFTQKYEVRRLIYFECYSDIRQAKEREIQIKGWTRKKKLDLVRVMNPQFRNLIEDLY